MLVHGMMDGEFLERHPGLEDWVDDHNVIFEII